MSATRSTPALCALALRETVIVSLAGLLTACSGAPSQNVFGSYFPSWMLCAIAGLFAALVVRQVLIAAGIGKNVPAPILVFLALAVALSFAGWLLWIG